MPRVTFILPDESELTTDLAAGTRLMQGALAQRVRGIIAECGGVAQCATCHVFLEGPAAGRFPRPEEDEEAMLESTAVPRTAASRLSCQLVLGPEHEGLVVRLPERQA